MPSPEVILSWGFSPQVSHFGRINPCLVTREPQRLLEWVAYPSQGDVPNLGIELRSPVLQSGFFYQLMHQEAHLRHDLSAIKTPLLRPLYL